jgi:hypothetical protein
MIVFVQPSLIKITSSASNDRLGVAVCACRGSCVRAHPGPAAQRRGRVGRRTHGHEAHGGRVGSGDMQAKPPPRRGLPAPCLQWMPVAATDAQGCGPRQIWLFSGAGERRSGLITTFNWVEQGDHGRSGRPVHIRL